MASFNPLAMILNQKPLDENNFEDWKTNLYIVLDYEKIKFVLDTPKPAISEAGANDITKIIIIICDLGECKHFTSMLYSC